MAISRRACSWLLGLLALGAVLAVAFAPRLPEPATFRSLADGRTLLGIANFWNVVSNLPFLLVGAWGIHFLAVDPRGARAFECRAEQWPYLVCFVAVAFVAPGSAYYHLAPDDARLMWDRLPIAVAFAALLAAVVAERIDPGAGLRLLLPALALGAGSVLYWRWSVAGGMEDVLPYAVVQYGSLAAILLIALLRPSRYSRGSDLYGAVALYAAAKAAELLDAPIYAMGQLLSGHTIKHLLAALAAGYLLRMLRLRSAR